MSNAGGRCYRSGIAAKAGTECRDTQRRRRNSTHPMENHRSSSVRVGSPCGPCCDLDRVRRTRACGGKDLPRSPSSRPRESTRNRALMPHARTDRPQRTRGPRDTCIHEAVPLRSTKEQRNQSERRSFRRLVVSDSNHGLGAARLTERIWAQSAGKRPSRNPSPGIASPALPFSRNPPRPLESSSALRVLSRLYRVEQHLAERIVVRFAKLGGELTPKIGPSRTLVAPLRRSQVALDVSGRYHQASIRLAADSGFG